MPSLRLALHGTRFPADTPHMEPALAVALTVLYVGLSLAFGGVHPANGFPLWFFVPGVVSMGGAFIASRICAALPVPWSTERFGASRPRRVHLSWRAAVRIPVVPPALLIPWHFLWIVSLHFDISAIWAIAAVLAAVVLLLLARRRRREVRLLRDGEMTAAVVDGLVLDDETDNRIAYHFTTPWGDVVSGRVWDKGYGVTRGSAIPVFYDAHDPKHHVVACGTWFEAD